MLYSRKYLTHVICNNNRFTVQTVSETCVQCVRYSDPRHSAGNVSIHRCSYQWSTVIGLVCATPSQSASAMCRGSEWCFANSVYAYSKTIIVTNCVLQYFQSIAWLSLQIMPVTNFYDYQNVLDVLTEVASSGMLHFHSDKIGIMSLVALCSLYIGKII